MVCDITYTRSEFHAVSKWLKASKSRFVPWCLIVLVTNVCTRKYRLGYGKWKKKNIGIGPKKSYRQALFGNHACLCVVCWRIGNCVKASRAIALSAPKALEMLLYVQAAMKASDDVAGKNLEADAAAAQEKSSHLLSETQDLQQNKVTGLQQKNQVGRFHILGF